MFFGIVLIVAAVAAVFAPIPEPFIRLKRLGSAFAVLAGIASIGYGGVSYNDAGMCAHVRTIFGSEKAKCDLGWYFSGWGTSTEYPHYITVSHTADSTDGSVSDLPPYKVRLSDNWNGTVIQTTRFGIPQDTDQFLRMARDYRSPERLIVTLLRPAVTSSLDSVANLYSMEEYWTGGKRDEFKTEFELAVQKGRPAIDRVEETRVRATVDPDVAASDSDVLDDTAEIGTGEVTVTVTKKRLDANGAEIRIAHDYLDYGIAASSAIIENLDPDDLFEERIQARKDAASRRIIAREQRLEQEEQRLLAIAEAERNIAQRQGEARVTQIEQTTDAETKKRLALVDAERQRDEARIAKERAQIDLDRARIDAQAVQVRADAAAYEKQAILEADNALQQKLDAEVAIQKVWAEAYSKRSVPQFVMGAGEGGVPVGSDSEVQTLLQLLTADTAKRLAYDRSITKAE